MLKIHSIDNGFCRINYTGKNSLNQTIYYCLQEEHPNDIRCYRSSQDLEPSHECVAKAAAFEVPTGNSAIEVAIRKRLLKPEDL